jgi:hypothetical protein
MTSRAALSAALCCAVLCTERSGVLCTKRHAVVCCALSAALLWGAAQALLWDILQPTSPLRVYWDILMVRTLIMHALQLQRHSIRRRLSCAGTS